MKLVISAAECAEALATTPNEVQKLLKSGELPAYRQGKNWKIPISLLQKYIEDKATKEAEERRKSEQ